MSDPEIEGYIAELHDLHAELLKWCDGLPAAGLNWRPLADPQGDTNSVYIMLTHVIGSEAWWIQQIIGGVDIKRDRPSEFTAVAADIAALRARLTDMDARNAAVLRGLTMDDLAAMRDTVLGAHDVRWCILHVVEHTSRHIGHIELTRQLWERQL